MTDDLDEEVWDDDKDEWRAQLNELEKQYQEHPGRLFHSASTSLVRVTEAWLDFATTLSTLLHACEEQEALSLALFDQVNRDARDEIVRHLDAALLAYTAGVGAVVDQTRDFVRRYGDENLGMEYNSRIAKMGQDVPEAEFMVKLRNYVLHYLSAPWGWELQWPGSGESMTTQLGLDTAGMLKMGWNQSITAFLESQPKRIHLTPMVDRFTEAESQLVQWVVNTAFERNRESIDEANQALAKYNLHLTGGVSDGRDWNERLAHIQENLRRMEAGEEQLNWQDVRGKGSAAPN